MSNTNRTQLTDKKLKESINILRTIIDVCADCSNETSFNEACRKRNLNSKQTRELLLKYLGRCNEPGIDLKDMELNVFDGYEHFYKAVFGISDLDSITLPQDYKESVLHVVNETGLAERESFVLMKHFQLDEEGISETLQTIGEKLNITGNTVRCIEVKALHKCRYRERADILIKGLSQYRKEEECRMQLHAMRISQFEAEYEQEKVLLEALHTERMNRIAKASNSDEVISITLPPDIVEILENTPLSGLNLCTRSENALRRGGVPNMLKLIAMNKKEIAHIRNIGAYSVKDILEQRENYVQERYHITADKLREIVLAKTIKKGE